MLDGYQEAELVDKEIVELFELNSESDEGKRQLLKYLRTIETTCNILKQKIYVDVLLAVSEPKIGSKWIRHDHDGSDFFYTVIAITNMQNKHDTHPPQVVYQGTNAFIWSYPLAVWPNNLVPKS